MKSQERPESKVAKVWHTTMEQSIFGRLDAQAVGLERRPSVLVALFRPDGLPADPDSGERLLPGGNWAKVGAIKGS